MFSCDPAVVAKSGEHLVAIERLEIAIEAVDAKAPANQLPGDLADRCFLVAKDEGGFVGVKLQGPVERRELVVIPEAEFELMDVGEILTSGLRLSDDIPAGEQGRNCLDRNGGWPGVAEVMDHGEQGWGELEGFER